MSSWSDLAEMAGAYVTTKRRRRLTAPAIERLQRRGLLAHPGLARHLARGGAGGETLQVLLDRLTLSDPSSLRRDFQLLNRLGLSLPEARARALAEAAGGAEERNGYSFGLSTGSEGEPGVFITSPAERARYVGTVLGKLLAPGELVGRRVALLLKHNNELYRDTGRSRLVTMSYFDISTPLASWIARLIADDPDIMIGPPSALLAVAEHAAFAARPLRPRILITGAEPTFPSDARRLKSAYGTAPRPIYQTCEGFIALACGFGTLHVNEDTLVAEWRSFRCDGVHAAPVITDFSRRTQDVWRTLLPDVVRLRRTTCPCGSAFRGVDCVEGRFSDVLYAASDTGDAPRLVFPFALDAQLQGATPQDCQWRIEQESPGSLAIATSRELTTAERTALRDRLVAAGGWTRMRWDTLAPRPLQVKRRRFVRAIDPRSEAILRTLGPPGLRGVPDDA